MTAELNTRVQRTADLNATARLNDLFRQSLQGGTLVATAGVIHLARDALPLILAEVQAFNDFTRNNDPYGEHDFGAFTWCGARLFWKIDCYDRQMLYALPDRSDADQTLRVLTVMLASEY